MHVLVHILLLLFSHIRSLQQQVQKIAYCFLISGAGAGIPSEH